MGTMIMNMSQGSIEREEPLAVEYDEEIMCSGWNPAVAITQLAPEDKHRSFSAELIGVDLESFLHKMYG